MNPQEIERLSTYLDEAMLQGTEVEKITARLTEQGEKFTLEDAYRIQEQGISRRYQRGEKYLGMKMGLTSQAKRDQMGLRSPIYGVLTDKMRVRSEAGFSLKGSIHPKIEPEIAFWTGKELGGRISLDEALAACTGVAPAMEILDSRFTGFKYFSLEDVVADNASSAYYVVGEPPMGLTEFARSGATQLDELPMEMWVDGVLVQSAVSSAISDHPGQSIVQLCEILHTQGRRLPAGSLVLAGAATQAVPMVAGMKVELRIAGLGSVSVQVRD